MGSELKKWLKDLVRVLRQKGEPEPEHYARFINDPVVALDLIKIIAEQPEEEDEKSQTYYSACVLALDLSVAQLQTSKEGGNKIASKVLDKLMMLLASEIHESGHSLSFWLPILNVFYDTHVELSEELKRAYLNLAEQETESTPYKESSHLDAIRDLIEDLSDLSVFDITENFFAQSYAMPADFFADLVIDLYSIEEGKEIALLMLLHPKPEVREVVVLMHDHWIEHITMSDRSLTRLKSIKNWYPKAYHPKFDYWIKTQRKKGVVFCPEMLYPPVEIKASEVDGSGAQGIFIHIKKNNQHRLCGLLLKSDTGIKDAWITPSISVADIKRYYQETFEDSVMLRPIDLNYLILLTNHFLALTVESGNIPDLHFLEIQEELGVKLSPARIDIDELMTKLSVQIAPFTPDTMRSSFARSNYGLKIKDLRNRGTSKILKLID